MTCADCPVCSQLGRWVRPRLDSPLAVLLGDSPAFDWAWPVPSSFSLFSGSPHPAPISEPGFVKSHTVPGRRPPRPRAALDEVMCRVNASAPYPQDTQCFTKSAGTYAPSEVPFKKPTSVPAASFQMNSPHEQWCVNHHFAMRRETHLVTLSPPENPWDHWDHSPGGKQRGDHTEGKPGFSCCLVPNLLLGLESFPARQMCPLGDWSSFQRLGAFVLAFAPQG